MSLSTCHLDYSILNELIYKLSMLIFFKYCYIEIQAILKVRTILLFNLLSELILDVCLTKLISSN